MAKILEGKIALVTGGARGVGCEVVRRLAREGADVAFLYGTSEAAARETEKEAGALGVRAKGYHANLENPETLPDVAKAVLADFGRIDILVNCAGIFTVGMIGDIAFPDYERAMNVNLDSVYYLTSEVSKTMQPGSRIINISSTLAERAGGAAIAVYNATKAGVSSLARSWAHDLGARGILVNAIQPGHINTDMNPDTTDYHHEMVKRIPLARYAEPAEIAGVVAFLAGPDAAYITGATINVDGGLNG
ncbi:SDR family NAD(P)-dependent oxidoreductase [Segnochrobactrum spirostomi]|uniref:SDR family oxidoreductase n=1 Tax=Segnochrobactrum spirostomi TaxID=2608987 RepID=A0A6A7Y7W8_9HYPH|nr:SDR family oxidoreductase [Segnochrobactrum spirostomi]MQT14785.1 SDR family oxidoreductase [Segnochrobactrum spirostomi]